MQAVLYERQGLASEVLVVGRQPIPEPGPGEVRVRIRASGVNPSDCKMRKGGGGRKMIAPLVIPHSDGAGDIDAVGTGVPQSRIGERVWIWNGQWKRAFGTAANFTVLPSAQAVAMPSTIDYAQGACLGIPALTAMQAVRTAAVQQGMIVLVAGGAGSVGHYAIQMAKARGATVLATVSSEVKEAHARAAGADHVINYRREDVGTRIQALTKGLGVEAVLEVNIEANAALYPAILRPHGTVVVYGISGNETKLPSLWMLQNSIALRFFMIYEITLHDREACLSELDALLRADRITHTIGLRLPLAEAARAHELVENGTIMGRVVLDIH